MIKTTEKEYPGGIVVQDWGKPEYLDGAQMQYAVVGKKGTAYFSNKEDAHLFAKAKSAGLK
jgi:hypothetical protein